MAVYRFNHPQTFYHNPLLKIKIRKPFETCSACLNWKDFLSIFQGFFNDFFFLDFLRFSIDCPGYFFHFNDFPYRNWFSVYLQWFSFEFPLILKDCPSKCENFLHKDLPFNVKGIRPHGEMWTAVKTSEHLHSSSTGSVVLFGIFAYVLLSFSISLD